ncbi:hypothetical protein AcW1_006845 [Taiwanofungus camphoratus]|nr:hypothetical protein AcV5_009423 [Antrodia cinnamomea]KAI0955188.1 hypothetical protein AcW1_006845 [Antrodia cinnamomea]
MPTNKAAENALGTMGAICWTIQLVPQIWKSWRRKSTEGLSHWLVLLWGLSGAFLGVYAIVQDLNIPLIIQPQLFGILSFVSWTQCQYYGNKRPLAQCIVTSGCIAAVAGGFQAGMVFAVRPAYHKGDDWSVKVFGIISSVIIAVALLPQYYEIYRHREVIGISVLFMAIDLLGGVFSDLSLAFKAHFDVVAGVTYSLVVVMDGIVILLALILNPRARRCRKRIASVTTGSPTGATIWDAHQSEHNANGTDCTAPESPNLRPRTTVGSEDDREKSINNVNDTSHTNGTKAE